MSEKGKLETERLFPAYNSMEAIEKTENGSARGDAWTKEKTYHG